MMHSIIHQKNIHSIYEVIAFLLQTLNFQTYKKFQKLPELATLISLSTKYKIHQPPLSQLNHLCFSR